MVVFLHHTGVPVMDLRFDSLQSIAAGSYHTLYDTYNWMTTNADPDFQIHASMVKLIGVLVINAADTALLPFTFKDYSTQLTEEVADLKQDPSGNLVNWTSLSSAIAHFADVANQINLERQDDTLLRDINALKLRCLNDRLFQAERGFLFLQGIPGREWYRHLVWATSIYNAYDSSGFGTIGDALAINDLPEAQKQIDLVSILIEQTAAYLTQPSYTPK